MLALVLAACSGTPPEMPPPPPTSAAFREDTVLLYWLPYDNDLGHAAGPVLEGLRQATQDGRVQIAAQVDTPGTVGMQRVAFRDGRGLEEPVPDAEDSAGLATLQAFLDWAAVRYEARHYAVFVLDHGGDLPRLARDDRPTFLQQPGPSATWLSTTELAAAVAAFRAQEPGEVEALVMQVCGKASVAAAWEVRHAARSTLASQLPLGAPNTYYPALATLPDDWDGADLLGVLTTAEAPSMYATWSCVDNRALDALPGALASLTDIPPDPAWLDGPLAPLTWTYAGDAWTDLSALARIAGAAPLERTLDALSCGRVANPAAPPLPTDGFADPTALGGLSVYLPPADGMPADHAAQALFRDTHLGPWLEALVRPPPPPGPGAG
ncbi:MAG: hypothetical protein H6742_12190 [Alphaproteobacteria bacterium]|nr:hypothetical protein [Alphaproteobacteria bacterium]